MSNQEALEEVLLGQLQDGPLYRFSDYASLGETAPRTGAGLYTIWDAEGALVYAGIVYVADHYVRPELTRDQIEAIRDSRLSMDSLVREKIPGDFAFRFAAVDDYAAALRIENAIKGGALPDGRSRLNPAATP